MTQSRLANAHNYGMDSYGHIISPQSQVLEGEYDRTKFGADVDIVIATAHSQCTRRFGSGGVGAVAVPVSGRHIDVAGPRSNRISTCVEGLD